MNLPKEYRGKLPNFQRVKNRFPRVQNLSNKQYIMRTPRHQHFVHSTVKSAKNSTGYEVFEMSLIRLRGIEKMTLRINCLMMDLNLNRIHSLRHNLLRRCLHYEEQDTLFIKQLMTLNKKTHPTF